MDKETNVVLTELILFAKNQKDRYDQLIKDWQDRLRKAKTDYRKAECNHLIQKEQNNKNLWNRRFRVLNKLLMDLENATIRIIA